MWFLVPDFVQDALNHAGAIVKFSNLLSEEERLFIPGLSEK